MRSRRQPNVIADRTRQPVNRQARRVFAQAPEMCQMVEQTITVLRTQNAELTTLLVAARTELATVSGALGKTRERLRRAEQTILFLSEHATRNTQHEP